MKAKATRQSFGEALAKLGHENPNIVALDADLSCSTKSAVFAKEFPERFFQMGIAEANMVGTAAGLASMGYVPFICSFGCFLAGRYETIRLSVGYSEANVKIVGTHSGIGIGEDGYSQMGLEDVNTLRALPGMTILQPSDELTTHGAVRWAAENKGPVYLRLTRQNLPALYQEGQKFEVGKAITLQEGGDKVALIASGATVCEAKKACEQLGDLNPWIIDMHTLKPIDKDIIEKLSNTCSHIITVEDHNVIGGLGSAVAEVMAEKPGKARLSRLGMQDAFGESGKPEDLYLKYGLAGEKMAGRIKEIVS